MNQNMHFFEIFSILSSIASSKLPVMEEKLFWTTGLLLLTICDAHKKPNCSPRGPEIGSKWTKICVFMSFLDSAVHSMLRIARHGKKNLLEYWPASSDYL